MSDTLPGAWWERPLWGLDFETTSPIAHEARPVSVALLLVDVAGNVLRRCAGLIDPEIPIPAGASEVHGITDETIRAGPTMTRLEAVSEITRQLATYRVECAGEPTPIVIFNAPYDWPLLVLEAKRLGVSQPWGQPLVDPLLLDRYLDKWRKGLRTLAAGAARWGVTLTDAHDAAADVIASVQMARAIARAWAPVPGRFGIDQHTRHYQQTDMLFPGLQRYQSELYRSWRDDVNEYWRRADTRDNGVLRQATGSWPLGDLDPITLEPRVAAATSDGAPA